MKSFVFVAAGLTTLICGCASIGGAPLASENDNVDAAKVALVNQQAKNKGIAVYWLNYPQRHATDATAPAATPSPTGT